VEASIPDTVMVTVDVAKELGIVKLTAPEPESVALAADADKTIVPQKTRQNVKKYLKVFCFIILKFDNYL